MFRFVIFLMIFNILNLSEVDKYCYKGSSNNLIINNFDHFNEFNSSVCYANESNIILVPNRYLVLNSSLVLNLRKDQTEYLASITYFHLEGIDLNTRNLQIPANKDSNYLEIVVKNSFFIFYNKNQVINEDECDSKEIYNSFNSTFSNLFNILRFMDCFYSNKICIWIFKNSFIDILVFEYLSSTSIKKNHLQFNTRIAHNFSLNSQIHNVGLTNVYGLNLNDEILNHLVFKDLKSFVLTGSIYKIQLDIFKYLNNIESIGFELYNIKFFVHQGMNWTTYLENINTKKIRVDLMNYPVLFHEIYNFPDEDWCLFKDTFKNKNLTLYHNIELNNIENLTCPLAGIHNTQNIEYVRNLEWYVKCCLNDPSIFYNLMKKCEKTDCLFNEINKTYSNDDKPFDYYQFIKIVNNLEFSFDFIIQPFILIIGVVSNGLIMLVLKKKSNKKDFEDRMYLYVYYNSLFNLCIHLLETFDYINKCSINLVFFCPVSRETPTSQYVFIILNFLKSFLKFCSNFSLLLFSLGRLVKILDNKSKYMAKLLNFIDKHSTFCIFGTGILLNSPKMFQYKINYEYTDSHFPIEIELEDFDETSIWIAFFMILFISDIISNIILQIFILLIDVSMFIYYKKALENKKNVITTGNKKSNKTNRLIKFIFLFTIVNFVLRIPELGLFFISKVYIFQYTIESKNFLRISNLNSEDPKYSCFIFRQYCDKILKLAQELFRVSFLSNFFTLLFSNKTFRQKFKNVFYSLKKT